MKVEYKVLSVPTARVGEVFEVKLRVVDLRPQGIYFNETFQEERNLLRGVFAAYIGIEFSKIVSVDNLGTVNTAAYALSYRNCFKFKSPYTNGKTAARTSYGCRVGAFSSDFDGHNEGEYEVCSIRFRAEQRGTAVLCPSVKGLQYPVEDTLVFGNSGEESYVSPTEILFSPWSIQIV